MIKFEEWLIENHPEILEEGKLTNALGALALTGASLFGGEDSHAAEFKPALAHHQPALVHQQVDQHLDFMRLESMKKVSNSSNFKKNWGSDFDQSKEQQTFNIILRLKTPEDHDHFSKKLQVDMQEVIRNQLLGSSPQYYKFDKERAIKSYDYQFLRYLQQLTIASKNTLTQSY